MLKALRISIVIPAHNEEKLLGACLDAIAAQTIPPFEVIVVDNCSTDRTAAIAKTYPFVRVIKERRQGTVFARNAGFDAVKGDVIGRIDADTLVPANWVRHISDFYSRPNSDNQALTGFGTFKNAPSKWLFGLGYRWLAFNFNWLFTRHYTLWGSNMAILPGQWQKVRHEVHLRTDIHEDLDLAMHLHDSGYKIIYDKSLQVGVRLNFEIYARGTLWSVLKIWPRTLKIHGNWAWRLCWFFGTVCPYLCFYLYLGFYLSAQRFWRSTSN